MEASFKQWFDALVAMHPEIKAKPTDEQVQAILDLGVARGSLVKSTDPITNEPMYKLSERALPKKALLHKLAESE